MKNLAPLFIALLIAVQSFSQVGINTTEPTATLDVDGTIRVRKINSSFTDAVAEKLVGMDEDGSFVEVEVEENLILHDNELRAVESIYRFTSISLTVINVNNLDLIILPGEPNDDKKVIRIINSTGDDVIITGLKAGQDGQTLWLYAYSGNVKLVANSPLSDPENRFLMSNDVDMPQYTLIQLLYDATLQKWLIMSAGSDG
ncbi:MAG: hypothetical protein O6943_10955 [Bacteroidetes bacterium]|nr:hypothetical protein [Bacteroidota bacterium]